MPRGGLSSDPEKRERQLAGLRQNWPGGKPPQTSDSGGKARKADDSPPQTSATSPAKKATSGRKRVTDYPSDSGGKKRAKPKQEPPAEPAPTGGRARGFFDGILGRY